MLQLDLVGPWVDLREQLALRDHLPLREGDRDEIAADLREHGDGRGGGDGAELIERDRHGAGDRFGHTHRLRGRAARGFHRTVMAPDDESREQENKDGDNPVTPPPERSRHLSPAPPNAGGL